VFSSVEASVSGDSRGRRRGWSAVSDPFDNRHKDSFGKHINEGWMRYRRVFIIWRRSDHWPKTPSAGAQHGKTAPAV